MSCGRRARRAGGRHSGLGRTSRTTSADPRSRSRWTSSTNRIARYYSSAQSLICAYAGGGSRTHTALRPEDFESIPAGCTRSRLIESACKEARSVLQQAASGYVPSRQARTRTVRAPTRSPSLHTMDVRGAMVSLTEGTALSHARAGGAISPEWLPRTHRRSCLRPPEAGSWGCVGRKRARRSRAGRGSRARRGGRRCVRPGTRRARSRSTPR